MHLVCSGFSYRFELCQKRWWSCNWEEPTAGEALDNKESTQVLHGGKDSIPKRANCGSQELSSIHKTKAATRGPRFMSKR